MTTSGAMEPRTVSEASTETWREAVSLAKRERRQRGERYAARHRLPPADREWHEATQQSA